MDCEEFDLPLLESLLQAKFYVPCQCCLKDSTYFCIECKDLSFSETCKINKHDGHNLLQVYKASYQVVLKIGSIKELFETSDIQSYIINSKRIVYLTQRQSKGLINHRRGEGHGSGNKCETCGWTNLFAASKYCSVECKVCLSSEAAEQVEVANSASSSITKSKCTSQSPPNSCSKRSRKGVSTRSPFM